MHWIDPAYLPETLGTVDRFLINTHGDADGLLLTDGTEVLFPPHMSALVVAGISSGTEVTIRGIRPRGADMVDAVSLGTADGTKIIDQGPSNEIKNPIEHSRDKHHQPMDVEGVVERVLHGPKGEMRGVLLKDGRIVRMPAHAAAAWHDLLVPGNTLAARGKGLTNELGTVVSAQKIGSSISMLHPVEPKKHDKAA